MRKSRENGLFLDIPQEQWNDWHWQLSNRVETLEDLKKEGFGDAVIDALALLTHDDDTPYMDYVARIKENPIAKAVKLADLAHNSDLSRMDAVDERAMERNRKYL